MSLDTNPGNPTPNEAQSVPPHSFLHGFVQDAVVAIENYLGVAASAVTTSITYLVNHVTAIRGGTGLFIYAVGDLIYASTTTALSRLAAGTTGQVLTIVGGIPTWATSPVPVGVLLPYGGSSTPTGFLLCDGSAVSRATYAALFAAIGTSYGTGDGTTTFNLPNTSGRTFIGAGTGTKVATFASRSSNVITVTGLTSAANNEFQTGQIVTYVSSGSVITGLTSGNPYYLIRTGNLTFSVASSLANAQNGTVISLSSDGSGIQTFTLALTTRTVGDTGGEETHAMSSTELLLHHHTYSGLNGGGISSSGASNIATSLNTGDAGGNVAMNNMQPFFSGVWIIKT